MPDNDININEVIAILLQNELGNIASALKNKISKPLKELKLSFTKYLAGSYKKINMTKTLLYKDSSVALEEIYVDSNFEFKGKVLTTDNIVDSILPEEKFI